MNWYSLYKCAQIWAVDSDGSFIDELSRLYELEYKYSMLRTQPFRGHEKRYENILTNLGEELRDVIVANVLIPIFQDWLDKHALLDPMQWAQARYDDYTDGGYNENFGDVLSNIVAEYWNWRYADIVSNRQAEQKAYSEVLDQVVQNTDQYPSLANLKSLLWYDERNRLYDDLEQEGFEQFGDQVEQEFVSDEQARQYIDNLDEDSYDVSEALSGYGDKDSFISMVENHVNTGQLALEMFANIVFPVWFERWQGEGIEATREGVEEAHAGLLDSGEMPLGEAWSAINHALNVTHQTGDMTDYIEEDTGESGIREHLDALTGGDQVEEWNKQLREVGLQI